MKRLPYELIISIHHCSSSSSSLGCTSTVCIYCVVLTMKAIQGFPEANMTGLRQTIGIHPRVRTRLYTASIYLLREREAMAKFFSQ